MENEWQQKILPELLKRELGVHNWADDRGGKTAHGVTERVAIKLGLDIDKIDEEKAMWVYASEYYSMPKFDELPDLRLAWRMTLDGLHSGSRTVTKRMQWLINMSSSNKTKNLRIDGLIGPQTLRGIDAYLGELAHEFSSRGYRDVRDHAVWDFCSQLKSMQHGLYCHLVDNDPSQRKWFRGWLNRIRFEPEWYEL